MNFSLPHMLSSENYDMLQDIAVAPRHHRIGRQHTASRYTPSPAVRAHTTPQLSSQNAVQRREWDAYPVGPHLENARSSRRGTSRAPQEYILSYDRHLPTTRSTSVTVDFPPYQATNPKSRIYPEPIFRPT